MFFKRLSKALQKLTPRVATECFLRPSIITELKRNQQTISSYSSSLKRKKYFITNEAQMGMVLSTTSKYKKYGFIKYISNDHQIGKQAGLAIAFMDCFFQFVFPLFCSSVILSAIFKVILAEVTKPLLPSHWVLLVSR